MNVLSTVKAPNFGPRGNFGPFFPKGLLSLKRVLQKNEENGSCRKTVDLQIRFCSFFVHDSSTWATELARKSPKLPWCPKLEAFTVTLDLQKKFLFSFHAVLTLRRYISSKDRSKSPMVFKLRGLHGVFRFRFQLCHHLSGKNGRSYGLSCRVSWTRAASQ
jgi:hypothetical protein